MKNLFSEIPKVQEEELFEEIARTGSIRIERIVSDGHRTPQGQWFDQDTDEWVVLLKGRAELKFERERDPVLLNSGDHILIPAHAKHRVEWTDDKGKTIWLAVHF